MTKDRSDPVVDHVGVGLPGLLVGHSMRDIELIDVVSQGQIIPFLLALFRWINVSTQQSFVFIDPLSCLLNSDGHKCFTKGLTFLSAEIGISMLEEPSAILADSQFQSDAFTVRIFGLSGWAIGIMSGN